MLRIAGRRLAPLPWRPGSSSSSTALLHTNPIRDSSSTLSRNFRSQIVFSGLVAGESNLTNSIGRVLMAGFRASYSGMAMGLTPAEASCLLRLNDLRPARGSTKQKTRKGRGIGSGKGKTAGRGHKGQRARGTMKFGFEGGQTPLRRRLPRRGFKNRFSLTFQPVGLGKIAKLINAGKIDSSELITMKTLKDTAAVGKQIKDGVRLMGRGAEDIKWPIHLEVSRVTARAKAAVEAAGGSVRKVYYNKLGFKALLTPEWFAKKGRLLPRAARPPPKQQDKVDSVGRLPAPTKPIPFSTEEKDAAVAQAAS